MRALAAALLGATVLTLGATPTPAPAVVTESATGPVGFFGISSPTSTAVSASTTTSTLDVIGTGGVPSTGVTAVVVNLAVSAGSATSGMYVWPNTASRPTGTAVQYTSSTSRSTTITTQVGTDERIAFQTGSGTLTVTATVVGYYALLQGCSPGCTYHNRFNPAQGSTLYDGLARPWAAGAVLTEASGPQSIPIHSVAGVPATADQAVVRVSVFPSAPTISGNRRIDVRGIGTATPSVGQLSFPGNTTTSRVMTIPIASGGIEIFVPDTAANDHVNVRAVVDVIGSIDGTAYAPAITGEHVSTVLPDPITLTHGAAATSVDLRALGGLPAAYQALPGAVVLNVTVKGATAGGRVSLHTGGTIADVTFGTGAGVVATNQVVVPVSSAAATVPISYTATGGSGTVDIEVDTVGSYQFASYANPGTNSGDLFTAMPRTGLASQTLAAAATMDVQVTGVAGVPATGVSRVALAVHSINAAATTDVTVWGKDRPQPADPQLAASNARSSAHVLVEPGPDGKVRIKVGAASTQVSVSVLGWFTPYAGNGLQEQSVALIGDGVTEEVDDDVMALVDQEVRLTSSAVGSQARAEGIAHRADAIALSRPETVIVNAGTFDAKNGSNSAADTRDRILDHLGGFTHAPCRFVVTVNARTASFATRAGQINDALKAAATPDSRIGIIDWDGYLAATGTSGQVGTDGIPTTTGYAALSTLYAAAIRGDGTSAEAAYITPCSSTASFYGTQMGAPLEPAADPDLTIDPLTDTFTYAGDCTTVASGTGRDPLLMVGSGAGDSTSWMTAASTAGVLSGAGVVCTLTVPGLSPPPSGGPFMTGDQADFTRAAQHVVAAIRDIATATSDDVDVLAHSRGGFDLRWALRWYPDTRNLVDDAVMLGVPNHGSRGNMYVEAENDTTSGPDGAADNASIPAIQQSRADSLFEMALNSMDETPGGIDYTNLASGDDYDSVGDTSVDARTHAWMLDGATNILVQDHCAVTMARPSVPTSTWMWAAVHDALANNGPASDARISALACPSSGSPETPPTPGSTLVPDSEPPLPDFVPMAREADISPPSPTPTQPTPPYDRPTSPYNDDPFAGTDPGPSSRTLTEPGLPTVPADFVDSNCRENSAVNGPLLFVDGFIGQGGPLNEGSLFDDFDEQARLGSGSYPACWIVLPIGPLQSGQAREDSPISDFERGAQYVVDAIRSIEDQENAEVDIISHSRGGFDTRWALKWWPDTEDMVDDVIILGSQARGAQGWKFSPCTEGPNDECYRTTTQPRSDSRFFAALQIGDETPGDVSYTTIGSWDDGATVTRNLASAPGPEPDAWQYAWRLTGADNIVVQQHCAGARIEHGELKTDGWVWSAIQDALVTTDDGADPGRFAPDADCPTADFHPYPTTTDATTYVTELPSIYDEDQPYVWDLVP